MESPPTARAPYGREGKTSGTTVDSQSPGRHYQGESYYSQPAIKSSHYGQLVASYLFVGGLAGASQIIATIAELCGRDENRSVVRGGRYLALAGALASPLFLIADLRTPERWYNMLRIFRRTSTMSIGAWSLATFGAMSALTAAAQMLEDRLGNVFYRRLARYFALPAAATGAVISTYTGTLLSATSTPLWAGADRILPALFGTSATATSIAALSLAEQLKQQQTNATRRLERLALMAAGTELLLSSALDWQWDKKNLGKPLKREPIATAYRAGYKGVGLITPMIIHGLGMLTGRRSRTWSAMAALATLAGGYILRSVVLFAGRDSANRPEDYFHFTRKSKLMDQPQPKIHH
jgi:protein NrfD